MPRRYRSSITLLAVLVSAAPAAAVGHAPLAQAEPAQQASEPTDVDRPSLDQAAESLAASLAAERAAHRLAALADNDSPIDPHTLSAIQGVFEGHALQPEADRLARMVLERHEHDSGPAGRVLRERRAAAVELVDLAAFETGRARDALRRATAPPTIHTAVPSAVATEQATTEIPAPRPAPDQSQHATGPDAVLLASLAALVLAAGALALSLARARQEQDRSGAGDRSPASTPAVPDPSAEALSRIGEATEHARLLSINASIQAARLGDSGEALLAMTDELRLLAEHASNAARSASAPPEVGTHSAR